MSVNMRKPVSLVKNLRKVNAIVQLHNAEANRIAARFWAQFTSTGRVSLTRGVPLRESLTV